ncbi:MAG: D-alanyl-D-alanine carboxypeptidase family protein [Nitrospira sp.]|nr:D-alanyl-D-alanine carboxypeptidase family protein [Nitrospira sp.]
MNQRLERVEQCHPVIQQSVLSLVKRCEQELGRHLLIVHGYRSSQAQQLLYQKGREFDRETATWMVVDALSVVTNALPGLSAHNVVTREGRPASMAVDVIPLNTDGSADWDVAMEFWTALFEIAWKVGLDPLGDTTGAYLKGDLGHYEEPGWKLKIDGLRCIQPVSLTQSHEV